MDRNDSISLLGTAEEHNIIRLTLTHKKKKKPICAEFNSSTKRFENIIVKTERKEKEQVKKCKGDGYAKNLNCIYKKKLVMAVV